MSVSLFTGASGKYLDINKRNCINFFKAARSLSIPCSLSRQLNLILSDYSAF
ncbi:MULTISPECIES: hypothetical protein [unclassified Moorena]|uniref:hypothetical protein n=1 Tax=unclassified Moorena TaxID=2683338 RepID=UPI0013FEAB08|nr:MULTISPECIES: hypothetical protein [unclassified Moorena]NEO12764.1 hypothetical protein [Moorena sp. SIO3E8]NEP99539.1 hypothetical protein [Moorena sp. SIO3F7]